MPGSFPAGSGAAATASLRRKPGGRRGLLRARDLRALEDLDALKASIRQSEIDLRVERPPPEQGEARRQRWVMFRRLHKLVQDHPGRAEETVSWRCNGQFFVNQTEFRDLVQVTWPHVVFTDRLSPLYYKIAALFAALDLEASSEVDARELPAAMRVLKVAASTGTMKLVRFWVETYLDGRTCMDFAEMRRMLLTPAQSMDDVREIDTRLVGFFQHRVPTTSAAGGDKVSLQSGEGVDIFDAGDVEDIFRHTDLREVTSRMLWRVHVHDARKAVLDRRVEEATAEVNLSLQELKRQQILRRWQEMGTADRFRRWVLFTQTERLSHRADRHYFHRYTSEAVRRLRQLYLFRQEQRDNSARARRHCEGVRLSRTFEHWRAARWEAVTARRQQEQRADWLADETRLRRTWELWGLYVLANRHSLIEFSPEAEEHYEHTLLRKCLHAMRVLHDEEEDNTETEAEERQRLLMEFLSEAVEEVKDTKQERHEEHVAQRLQEEQKAQREENYQRDLEVKAARYLDRKKLKEQAEERKRFKEEQKLDHIAQRDEFWADMTKKALGDTERSARRFLRTADGRRMLQSEATWLYEEDPESCLLRAKTWQQVDVQCRWELVIEGKRSAAKAVYIEKATGRRAYATALTPAICKELAEDLIIGARFAEMRVDIAQLRQKEDEQYRLDLAARTIQGAWRGRKAFALLHSLGMALYTQTFDEASGRPLYYNLKSHVMRDCKPYICGSAPVPLETKPWVYRVDFDGNGFYENRSTGATSTQLPEGYIRCPKCRARPATRRCNDCGSRYCLRCFSRLVTHPSHGGHSWTKVPASGLQCTLCKTKADVVCRECKEEGFCEGCFELVHSDTRMASHSNVVSVGEALEAGAQAEDDWSSSESDSD